MFVCVCVFICAFFFFKQGPEGKPGMQGLAGIDGPPVSTVFQNYHRTEFEFVLFIKFLYQPAGDTMVHMDTCALANFIRYH